jgi:hypothetical protein
MDKRSSCWSMTGIWNAMDQYGRRRRFDALTKAWPFFFGDWRGSIETVRRSALFCTRGGTGCIERELYCIQLLCLCLSSKRCIHRESFEVVRGFEVRAVFEQPFSRAFRPLILVSEVYSACRGPSRRESVRPGDARTGQDLPGRQVR